jgi:PAS domain S-box-containing protein
MNKKHLKDKDLIIQSGLAALVLDEHLNIIEFNDELINITGFSRERLRDKNWHELISYDYPFTPVDAPQVKPGRTAPPSGKFWCSIKEKVPKKLVSATISYDSEKSLYFATLYDITEQVTPQRLVNDGGLLIGSIADHLRGAMAFHDSRRDLYGLPLPTTCRDNRFVKKGYCRASH